MIQAICGHEFQIDENVVYVRTEQCPAEPYAVIPADVCKEGYQTTWVKSRIIVPHEHQCIQGRLFAGICNHFTWLGRELPSIDDALHFINTELAEAQELWLNRDQGYVRNNPEDKEPFSEDRFAEELGDVIYMAMVTGWAAGVDPLEALVTKIAEDLHG